MKPSVPALVLLLTACHAPSPAMRGVMTGSQVIDVDGSRWRVDRSPGRAEAHRLNVDFRVARRPMVRRGALAITRATGCGIRPGTLDGDQAIVRAAIECDGPTVPVLGRNDPNLTCEVLEERVRDDQRPEVTALNCRVDNF